MNDVPSLPKGILEDRTLVLPDGTDLILDGHICNQPRLASPFWTEHWQKMQTLGIEDLRWILFALDDISSYCLAHGLKLSSHAIETAIQDLEDDVLTKD
ncbi:MAG: hypothetical protein AAF280_07925 [Pseudomonadota bacterium]